MQKPLTKQEIPIFAKLPKRGWFTAKDISTTDEILKGLARKGYLTMSVPAPQVHKEIPLTVRYRRIPL